MTEWSEVYLSTVEEKSDGSFGAVVSGLDAIIIQEGEKVLPVVKQPFRSSPYSWVGTVAENYTEIAHPLPHGQSIEPQLCSGATGAPKSMPEGEHCLYFTPYVPGKAIGMGTRPIFLESFQLADDMCPAELAEAVFMVTGIGRMIVAGNDAGKGIAKHFPQYFGTAAGRYMEEDGIWSDKSPEKATFALVFPAGFVDVEGWG